MSALFFLFYFSWDGCLVWDIYLGGDYQVILLPAELLDRLSEDNLSLAA